jgi:TonB-linked SusC/RagA family outer membrane protein
MDMAIMFLNQNNPKANKMKFLKFIVTGCLLLMLPAFLLAQSRVVTGVVSSNGNNPLAGATVAVQNSPIAAVADANGRFSLTVPQDAVLVVSFLGYKTQIVQPSSGDLSVQLEEDAGRLDEVLVTGLATTVKRRNLANAVVTINAKQLSGISRAQTFDGALNGKVPGAYITSNNGAPGGGSSVKLRGVTSIYGNTQPLYVIDGVFVNNSATSSGINSVTLAQAGVLTSNQDNASNRIADLRPEDIESIEILKGASASAIYGSKAAAGVILITTKRGSQGKTVVSFSQDLGFVKARKLLGVRQFTAESAASLSQDPVQSDRLRQQFLDAQAAGKIYDYEKEMYGNTGFTTNSVISVSGGTDKTSLFFSAANKEEEGIIKKTGYANKSIRLNIDHRINDNIKLSFSNNYIYSSSDRGLTGNDNAGVTYGVAMSSTPGFAELHPDENGVYPRNNFANSNFLETRDKAINNETVNRFITGINLDAYLLKSHSSYTKLVARAGFDFYNLKTDAQFPSFLQFQAVNKGTSIQGFTKNLNTNYMVALVNNFQASDNLSLTTSGGLTQETGDFNNLLNVATQVIIGQSNVDQAGALTATQFRTKNQDNGIFIQEEALLKDAVSINAGVRFDRSSNNGDPSKFYLYPKAGLAWNLTKMGIIDESLLQNLKLRAAYGQAGNFPAYGSKFTSLTVSNIEGLPGSVVSTQRGSAGIKPEKQTEVEAGFDFGVFDGRLNFDFTVYSKKVFDFLILNSSPASTGFATQWLNAGDLRNRGIEIGLQAIPYSGRDIKWNTTVNFWKNRSKVTRLTVPPIQLGALAGVLIGTFQIEEGKSATQIIGLTDEPGYMPPIKVWGDQEPKFQMSSFNEVTYKNKLSLRFLLHWKNGGYNANLTNLQSDFGMTSPDWDADANGNHFPDGLDRIMKIGSTAVTSIVNSGYFRIREIGLYYTIDKLPVNFVKNISLGASLYNYFTITDYPSYDPEVSNFGSGFSSGVDAIPYPASKRAAVHLNVTF